MKIPCENCITLAICKSIMFELNKDSDPGTYDYGIMPLCMKCSIFKNYCVKMGFGIKVGWFRLNTAHEKYKQTLKFFLMEQDNEYTM